MSSPDIHPSAIVSDAAVLGIGVKIGPFSVVEAGVNLGDGVEIETHAIVKTGSTLRPNVKIGSHCVIGSLPQDLSFSGQPTRLEIGSGTIFREGSNISLSTGEVPTRVGENCFVMAEAHVGHDCQVGNRVIIVHGSAIAGHCVIGDGAFIGGLTAVHQFVRIGPGAMIGLTSAVSQDVLPYSMAAGNHAVHYGLNKVGLRRLGVKGERYQQLEAVYRAFRERDQMPTFEPLEEAVKFLEFTRAESKRSYCGFAGRKQRG